jgi:uncharacterized UBP type Zn finger protein
MTKNEDALHAVNIAFVQAQTIRQLVDAGYSHDSVVQAVVIDNNWGALVARANL